MREVIFHGKLPDPFLKPDGTRMTKEEWFANRKEILDKIVDIEYGGMPPRPEFIKYEKLNHGTRSYTATWYKIYAGTKEKQLSFMLELHVPYVRGISPDSDMAPFSDTEKYPVILTGDGCYRNMESDTIKMINSKGYIAASFNRLEVANDDHFSREGGIYDIYDGDYTDISAWAWAYSVCMDVFERLSFVDETRVGITGHSRGGKTVMLAAAVDERIKYVCPNNSGCHGAVSHRCEVRNQTDITRTVAVTETMAIMIERQPTWMGPKLEEYKNDVDKLPYDMHYFGALIAPRYYLQCEGMQDYWINPIGAWQNFAAVKECYKYLGCEENAGAWFRPGFHRHKLPDYTEFMDFILRAEKGLPVSEHLKVNPYPEIEKNFDW